MNMTFASDIWSGYRPYAVKLSVDFLVAATIYVGLYLFELMKHFLPIPEWSANVLDNLHAAGSVAAFFIFSILSVIDIIVIQRKK